MANVKVYGLLNPLNNHIFYVGVSSYPEIRFQMHKYGANWNRLSHRYRQILWMRKENVTPELIILWEGDISNGKEMEDYYIKYYTDLGHIKNQIKSGFYPSVKLSHSK